MTIRKRLLLYILAPLISALLILSILDYFYSSWFLEKKASQMLLSGAKDINNEIQQSIRDTESDLAMLLSNRIIKEYVMYSKLGLLDYAEDERWKIEEDFLKAADEKPEYVSIRFIGLDGKCIIDIIDKKISYAHFDFSGEKWFAEVLHSGKKESTVSSLHPCKEHNKPSISISRLYYDDVGKKGGIVSLHVHADNFFRRILGKTIGEKGYAYLIDNRGVIVAHKDAAGTGAAVNEYESSKRVLAGDTGTITEFDGINSALMKKAYMPLQVKGLYLVISLPMSEISAFGIQLQLFNVIFFIATVIFVSIIGSIVAKRISKPINELHRGTEIIETGNMDHTIKIKTGDEIEQLATSFNKVVTGLKAKTDELRESEEKLRTIFNNAMDGILVADVKEKTFFAGNNMICKMLGCSMEEIKSLRVMDIHPEEDMPYVLDRFERQAKGEFSLAKDVRVKRKDGTVFYADINSSPVTLAGRTYLIGMFRDITGRKQSEDALRLSEEKFSKAFRSSPTFLTINTLREGRYIDVNNAFLDASGYSREEIIGRTESDIGIWAYPSDRKKMINRLGEQRIINNFETGLRVKTGNILTVLFSAELINIEGEPCILAVALDITERKKLENQLIHAQKMEAIGQLAGGIAHDFNNILSAIVNYAYLLRMRTKEEDPSRDNIEQILALSGKASDIIRSLLTFSRKNFINPVPLNLNNAVLNMEKLLAKFIGEDIRLHIKLTGKSPVIVADNVQIEQIIINLATNARDAMPDGGSLTIETDLVELDNNFIKAHNFGSPGAYALLSVSDTGMGMDEKTRQKIFEPFFTTKETGKGTGLGLAIIYGIVKRHNGYITVYSEAEKGTIFKIYFRTVTDVVEGKKETELPDLTGNKETVLLAEDSETVRRSMKNILKEFNYKTIEAVDGDDAVEKFIEHKDKIRLLILDVIMPGKNGKETLEEIRKISLGIKAIFTSGYTAEIMEKKGLLKEGFNFVAKPILPDIFLKKIKNVLNGSLKD